jgi:hypothetical protein
MENYVEDVELSGRQIARRELAHQVVNLGALPLCGVGHGGFVLCELGCSAGVFGTATGTATWSILGVFTGAHQ